MKKSINSKQWPIENLKLEYRIIWNKRIKIENKEKIKISRAIGKTLRYFRENKNFSTKLLNVRLRHSKSYIYKCERGLKDISLTNVVRLCQLIGVDIVEFALMLRKELN